MPQPPAYREPIGFMFVEAPEVFVHRSPQATSPKIETYRAGQPVTVLARNGDWSEVRLGVGTGWVQNSALVAEKPREDLSSASERIKFRKAPTPIASPGTTSGYIALEADVNSEGQVTAVRTLQNTTGSVELEARNRASLESASFYPLRAGGRVRSFIYNYRVAY